MSIANNELESLTPVKLSEDDYLKGEITSTIKHELINGEAVAMTGATINHDRIVKNLVAEFHSHLKNTPCEVLGQDIKVKVGSNYYYPDVLIDCDITDANGLFSNNPKIIIEVLSASTSQHDRTTKRLSYINIPSLEEYVLIEQEFAFVEVMRRSDSWKASQYTWGDSIHFASIDLTLTVKEIYHRVENPHIKALNLGLK